MGFLCNLAHRPRTFTRTRYIDVSYEAPRRPSRHRRRRLDRARRLRPRTIRPGPRDARRHHRPRRPRSPRPRQERLHLLQPTPRQRPPRLQHRPPHQEQLPITVDAGHVQYETDVFNYTHSNVGGVSTRTYTAFDPVLKIGLTNRVDVELQFGGYNWIQVNQPGSNTPLQRARGAGDLTLRAKVNLFGNEGGPAHGPHPLRQVPHRRPLHRQRPHGRRRHRPHHLPPPLGLHPADHAGSRRPQERLRRRPPLQLHPAHQHRPPDRQEPHPLRRALLRPGHRQAHPPRLHLRHRHSLGGYRHPATGRRRQHRPQPQRPQPPGGQLYTGVAQRF